MERCLSVKTQYQSLSGSPFLRHRVMVMSVYMHPSGEPASLSDGNDPGCLTDGNHLCFKICRKLISASRSMPCFRELLLHLPSDTDLRWQQAVHTDSVVVGSELCRGRPLSREASIHSAIEGISQEYLGWASVPGALVRPVALILSQLYVSGVRGISFDQIPQRAGRACKKAGSLERRKVLSSCAEKMLQARCCTSSPGAIPFICSRLNSRFSEVSFCEGGGNALSQNRRLANGSNEIPRPRYSFIGVPVRRKFDQHTMNCVGSISSTPKNHQEEEVKVKVKEELMESQFVHWFREGSPYIQGHRSSTFVIVLPGEVTVDSLKMDGILQDILLLHGLGVNLVIIPGTHMQIDQLLEERGHKPQYSGAYRVTDAEALAASMEAAGRVRVAIEAKLSRGPSIPILRRHGDNDRWHEVSIASGNFLAAKRRGVVNGVDFGATGEVKRIDVARIQERLDNDCIVMLTNLGYSSTGEVLNCNTYEVATACAIALQADKMLCLLDGTITDEDQRVLRFMTLQEADRLICGSATRSSAAADYVQLVAGSSSVQSQGQHTRGKNGDYTNGATIESYRKNGSDVAAANSRNAPKINGAGFAVGGKERLSKMNSYLSELTAAVFVCRNGVRRVHLLDSNIEGVLLLELYTRDGVGMMVSNDMYEGTRPAVYGDIQSIMELLRPLEESGVLVNRPREQLEQEFQNYIVVERDGSIIACAALIPYHDDKCGEVAAFAVSPECRGNGQGDSLLDYMEKKAVGMKLERLFLLTTRTADWFVHHGFSGCTVDSIPMERQRKIDYARGAKYYQKLLDRSQDYRAPRR